MANNSVTILKTMVNSFTNVDELMNIAATWGLKDSLAVRYKLFQMNTQYDFLLTNNWNHYYKLLEVKLIRGST